MKTILATLSLLSFAAADASANSKYFFVFGDSYTSNGFNASSSAHPTNAPGNQLGNPAYGQSTNCANSTTPCGNWIDILTAKYSPGNYLAFDFAFPGALASTVAVNSTEGRQYEFGSQVENFVTTVGTRPPPSYAPWTAANSVALVWFGVNDMLSLIPYQDDSGSTPLATPLEVETGVRNAIAALLLNVQSLYTAGLRNFLIIGCAPVDRGPGFSLSGRSQSAHSNITYWNGYLPYAAGYFANLFPGANVATVDPNPWWQSVENDPSHPQVWQDPIHPAAAVHSSIAYGVRGQLQGSQFNFY